MIARKTRSMLCVLAFGVLLSALGGPAMAASNRSAEEILQAANQAFESGAAALDDEPQIARNQLQQAASLYAQLIDDHGIENPKLHYNIGNAYMLLDDIGHAILHYRRAARLDTHDPNLAANLALARRQAPDRFERDTGTSFLRTILFLHYDVSLKHRFWIAWSLFVLIWLVILLRQVVSSRIPVLWPTAILSLLVATLSISVAVETHSRNSVLEGVVTASSVEARKGPDAEAYEPSFTQPLHAGVEFTIIERRDDWLRVRLPDGRETWLPDQAVAII